MRRTSLTSVSGVTRALVFMNCTYDFTESQYANQIAVLHHDQRTYVFLFHDADGFGDRDIRCDREKDITFHLKYL
ncbi:UNKNOWN [Stylonychia lemnae]|uniref:Uncharacterized protein n=1 Tax=Stylonychia lemnae TaxID=5949 RepID=A0A077ZSZ2_STYLE|nr:UNKNOWN [Stylonychia lemnae]|eukprot:CDW71586.1 UNKNOWN [Stylonychia lemnae]